MHVRVGTEATNDHNRSLMRPPGTTNETPTPNRPKDRGDSDESTAKLGPPGGTRAHIKTRSPAGAQAVPRSNSPRSPRMPVPRQDENDCVHLSSVEAEEKCHKIGRSMHVRGWKEPVKTPNGSSLSTNSFSWNTKVTVIAAIEYSPLPTP